MDDGIILDGEPGGNRSQGKPDAGDDGLIEKLSKAGRTLPGLRTWKCAEDQEQIDKINAAIKAIRANGKYAEITKKYFDFDVYGDDKQVN